MSQPPRLLGQVRQVIRLKRLGTSTGGSCLYDIRDSVLFDKKRHPREMDVSEIRAYLAHLALAKSVAASTQNVALNALVFLYRNVLEIAYWPRFLDTEPHGFLPAICVSI